MMPSLLHYNGLTVMSHLRRYQYVDGVDHFYCVCISKLELRHYAHSFYARLIALLTTFSLCE